MRHQRYYQNDYDQPLYKRCDSGNGMYAVRSVHDNHREDRRWEWLCRNVAYYAQQSCYWSRDVNDFDQPISFLCAHNYYLAGVDSYHDNHHEDRRWSFLCCNSPGHYSGYCYIPGYQNSWDGYMDFRAQRNREPMKVSGNHREDSNQGYRKQPTLILHYIM